MISNGGGTQFTADVTCRYPDRWFPACGFILVIPCYSLSVDDHASPLERTKLHGVSEEVV